MTAIQIDPFATASQMVAALRDREVSAVELLELHLRRIERHNPALNAIVTPDYDAARVAAANADTTRAEDGAGRLLGLPLTIKDSIDVRGPARHSGHGGVRRPTPLHRRAARGSPARRGRRHHGQDQCACEAVRLAVQQPHIRSH